MMIKDIQPNCILFSHLSKDTQMQNYTVQTRLANAQAKKLALVA